jgi:hypothetical protein
MIAGETPDLPPYTVLENGYIHGTWFCGRPTKPYYGSFPYGFWPRAKQVLRPWGSLLHWFSGLEQPEPGIVTVDGNPAVRPSVVCLGTDTPFSDATFDASFADPPYSPKDSERYGLPYPSATKVLAELARVTKPGGKIGLLHEFIPPTGGKKYLPVKLLGIIGIMNGPQKRIRLFAVYRKQPVQLALISKAEGRS